MPPTVRPPGTEVPDLYPDGLTRLITSMDVRDDGYGGYSAGGYVVLGEALYRAGYTVTNGAVNGGVGQRIGGGWGSFTALEESEYQGPTDAGVTRVNTYGLRGDGVLFRWTVDRGVWRFPVSAPGFAAVKSMVLISKAKTYDTFLANTRGGAPYTIHIPTSAPMKPVVKLVRASTWQVSRRCSRKRGPVRHGAARHRQGHQDRLHVRRRSRQRNGHRHPGTRQGSGDLRRSRLLPLEGLGRPTRRRVSRSSVEVPAIQRPTSTSSMKSASVLLLPDQVDVGLLEPPALRGPDRLVLQPQPRPLVWCCALPVEGHQLIRRCVQPIAVDTDQHVTVHVLSQFVAGRLQDERDRVVDPVNLTPRGDRTTTSFA